MKKLCISHKSGDFLEIAFGENVRFLFPYTIDRGNSSYAKHGIRTQSQKFLIYKRKLHDYEKVIDDFLNEAEKD